MIMVISVQDHETGQGLSETDEETADTRPIRDPDDGNEKKTLREKIAGLRAFFASAPTPADMNVREVNKRIGKIVWPSAVELFLTSLASMVDTMMVGQLGALAIAAVSLTTQPKFVLQALFLAFNSGATALVARFRGMGDQESANLVMRQSLIFTAAFSIILSAVGYFGADLMVIFMGAQADTLGPAGDYMRIQMIGFPFMAVTMVATAVLRGVGNTRASMVYNMTANVVNVIGNFLLIEGRFGFPRLEVAGASWATIIGQVVAFAMAGLALVGSKYYIRIKRGDSFKPNLDMLKRIGKIGIPAMVEQGVMRVGMLLYVRTVASLGTVAYAAHSIVMSIMNLSFMNGQAFGIVSTTLIGQSLGQQRVDRAKTYARYTRRMGMIVSLVIGFIFFFFGRQIVGLYTAGDAEAAQIIEMGGQVMIIIALMQPMQSSQLILNGALRGAGDTRSTAMIMFFGVLIVRPIAAHAFVNWFDWGLLGAWAAMALDQAVRSTLSYIRFQMGKWAYIRV
jgi:putative MATE family efflux protein